MNPLIVNVMEAPTGGLCRSCRIRPDRFLIPREPGQGFNAFCGICAIAYVLQSFKMAGVSLDEIMCAFPGASALADLMDAKPESLLVQ